MQQNKDAHHQTYFHLQFCVVFEVLCEQISLDQLLQQPEIITLSKQSEYYNLICIWQVVE